MKAKNKGNGKQELYVLSSFEIVLCFHLIVFLIFVIDEISEVKEKSIGFVRNTAKQKGTTFTYVLVPFSDPGRFLMR